MSENGVLGFGRNVCLSALARLFMFSGRGVNGARHDVPMCLLEYSLALKQGQPKSLLTSPALDQHDSTIEMK